MQTQAHKTQRLVVLAGALLAALLILIVGILYHDTRQNSVSVVSSESPQRIVIQRPGFADIVLTNTKDSWLIEQPCTLQTNLQRLQPMLGALAPVVHGYAAKEVDLAAAGLLDPQAVVYLNDTQIDIGGTDLTGERRYILRNQRVEFVPEWILSLINGGITALASLDVFTRAPDQLIIHTNGDTRTSTLSDKQLEPWYNLSAQQIVTWPLTGNESVLSSHTLELVTDSKKQWLTLDHFARFSAIRYENAPCAFILPTDDLPASAPR